MIVEIPRKRYFIQFAKYIDSEGIAGLQFDFPCAPWSRHYYQSLATELETSEVAFEIERVSRGPVTEFLVVDLGRDIERARLIAALSLQRVLGVSAEEPVEILFRNVSAFDEKIGG